jgi:hypothetical protein
MVADFSFLIRKYRVSNSDEGADLFRLVWSKNPWVNQGICPGVSTIFLHHARSLHRPQQWDAMDILSSSVN